VIAKDELLIFLKESLYREERAIPLYTRHLNSTMFLSDFSARLRGKIEDVLIKLKSESEGHAILLNSLIDKIKKSQKDVY
jgi:hypothetical protein